MSVFIANKSSHDFSDSFRYGESVFVTEGVQNKFSVENMARKWREALKNSSKEDYILITSLTILNCIGCAVFAAKHGRLNLLLYKSGRYISRTIELKGE